jgi:hypothetical protein
VSFGGLKCITVTPQLSMHYVPSSDGKSASEIQGNRAREAPADDGDLDLVMGQTQNTVKSARCMAMFGKSCLPRSQS